MRSCGFRLSRCGSRFFGSWLVFALLGPRLGWTRGRIGALILVCGLGNVSFMGYPMLLALDGKAALPIAVVADQLGCFPLLASAAVVVASVYAGRRPQPARILKRIGTFPACLALLVGIAAGLLGGWPAALDGVLQPLGATLTPLALFSVGPQFAFRSGERELGAICAGLGWKLLAAPLICLAIGKLAGVSGLVLTVGVQEAAMAPMIFAAILADEYELDPPLADTVLSVGIAVSLLSIPLGNWLLGG